MLTKTFVMNDNRIMKQISTIFGTFMVVFYIGVGIYLIFIIRQDIIDKPIRVIMGSTFIFYGLYRAYKAYIDIVRYFIKKPEDTDDEEKYL